MLLPASLLWLKRHHVQLCETCIVPEFNVYMPSHNNASEGGIRILKVKQKRSGGFRSQTGAEDFMAIHSVSDTAKKNNFSRWEAVLALV